MRRAGLEPARPVGHGVTDRLAHQMPADAVSSTGGSRTRIRQGLSLAALPVCVPCRKAPCTGLEPVSPARQAGRHTRFVTGRKFSERPAGVEPTHPPWQGGRQPLHHGRIANQSTRQESNLRGRRTRTAGCRYNTGASVHPAGAVGFEPTPGRFGGGHAAVTPHPCLSVVKSSSRQVVKSSSRQVFKSSGQDLMT